MKKNKVWKIRGFEGTFTDDEIISLIRSGQIKGDYALTCKDMKKWVRLKDSIYRYYMKEKEDETI